MRRLISSIPLSVVIFIGLTLAGTYFVRRQLLELAMRRAVKLDDEKMVASALASWPSPVDARLARDYTVLQWAIWEGKTDIVRLCLDRGARIEAPGAPMAGCPWRQTPLYMAVYRGRRDIVVLLLERGADVNAKDKNGRTPLSLTVSNGRRDLADLLRAHGAKE